MSFRSDGSLKTSAPVGPWTLDGQIEVQKIELRGGLLMIKGRRVHRIFDHLKPIDELTRVEDPKDKQQKDLQKALRQLNAEIKIELPGGNADDAAVTAAMHAVFLDNSESMIGVVPSYWRPYFARQEGKPGAPSANAFRVGGGISAPHATYQPDPEYSEEARKAKYQGTIVLYLVISLAGLPTDLKIERPLGLGLDEKAIEAVSQWKFEPARKDGEPVAAVVDVEVSFRLY